MYAFFSYVLNFIIIVYSDIHLLQYYKWDLSFKNILFIFLFNYFNVCCCISLIEPSNNSWRIMVIYVFLPSYLLVHSSRILPTRPLVQHLPPPSDAMLFIGLMMWTWPNRFFFSHEDLSSVWYLYFQTMWNLLVINIWFD